MIEKNEYIKMLEEYTLEYNEEVRKLNEKIEKYVKENKEIPDKLLKRIRECNALFDYYDGLIKQSIESELDMARKRQEAELRKSLGVRDCGTIPFGFNSFYGMGSFIR